MASRDQLIFGVFSLASLIFSCSTIDAQLSPFFYARTCPNLQAIVRKTMIQAVRIEPRMGASILRLFFHDCFVNGCDGSILLDDKPGFIGEKSALANARSVRGFEVIDAIKSNVETVCKATVSCADILALAAQDGAVLLGGPSWVVRLGRRDSTTASLTAANTNLPPPFANLDVLKSMFANKGLTARDMTALSGAHTIGFGRCVNFRAHIYNDTNIDPNFAALRQATCPASGGDDNLSPIDPSSPILFDNSYYQNLLRHRGLFHSDQELFNGGSQDALVAAYSFSRLLFYGDFVAAMIKMGDISPLTGTAGQIRLNCRVVNS